MNAYPMFQLCRALLQAESARVEKELEELRKFRAASIMIEARRFGPNTVSDQYTVMAVFCPEMFYHASMASPLSPDRQWMNIDHIAYQTGATIGKRVEEAVLDFAKEKGLRL